MLTIPWRTGVNMREFAYYGTSLLPSPAQSFQDDQLRKLGELGVKLVRFYATAKVSDFSPDVCVERVRHALDRLHAFGMQAIVCLDDSIGSDYSLPLNQPFHNTPPGHYHKDYWRDRKYNDHYMGHVRHLVTALANHPAVLVWELGNEYAMHPDNPLPTEAEINDFFTFASAASRLIKQLAPRKLVSTGLMNSRQISYALSPDAISAFARRLYGLPTIDLISIHYYQDDNEKQFAPIDVEAARFVRKPFYVGELGAKPEAVPRPSYYQGELQEWKDAGAFTVLLWGFDASSDAHVSDRFAFAGRFGDFNDICQTMRNFAANVAPVVVSASSIAVSAETVTRHEIPSDSEIKLFRSLDAGLRIRSAPSVHAARLGTLSKGEVIQVDPDSGRADDENTYFWWQHERGWSAEKRVDGTEIYMEEVDASLLEAMTEAANAAVGVFIPVLEMGSRMFRLIRKFPVDEGETVDVNSLPMRDMLFCCLPVDLASVHWTQPFGNTNFAFSLSSAAEEKTRNMYNFSQGLHGGIDLGYGQRFDDTQGRVVVRAGVKGTIAPPGTHYNPNRVRVNVGTDYQIIYGHLSATVLHPDYRPLAVDDVVDEDTIIGEIAPRQELLDNNITFTPHLHWEIRYLPTAPDVILNPLLFLPEDLRLACINKSTETFHPWTKWQTHFDQPVIRLGGGLIGPRAEITP